MSMREAFDIYFTRLNKVWQEKHGSYPKTFYLERCDVKGVYLPGTIDEEGYIQWQPKLQTESVDFESIEKELQLTIHPHLKEYFSTYWFMQLSGYVGENSYSFDNIYPNAAISQLIKKSREDGNIDYIRGVFFAVGDANQDCGLYVNNDNGEVICIDWDLAQYYDFKIPFNETSFKVSDSMAELIKKLEVR
ncbi:MAG: SecY-interacting protein Syd [Ruminococcus sp.]|nr:SecY-interacting protein Syd [Ruminococcus sp.]